MQHFIGTLRAEAVKMARIRKMMVFKIRHGTPRKLSRRHCRAHVECRSGVKLLVTPQRHCAATAVTRAPRDAFQMRAALPAGRGAELLADEAPPLRAYAIGAFTGDYAILYISMARSAGRRHDALAIVPRRLSHYMSTQPRQRTH